MDAIRAIRARRAEMNVAPGRKVQLPIAPVPPEVFTAGAPFFQRLAGASEVHVVPAAQAGTSDETSRQGMVEVITHAARAFMPLAELVDIEKEKARLTKDLGRKQGELKGLEGKLSNPGFLNKAPAEVVAAEKERAEKLKILIVKIEEQLKAL